MKKWIPLVLAALLAITGITSATEFTLVLNKGNNYVSIPLNVTIHESEIGPIEIWKYENGTWVRVDTMKGGEGYFVYAPYHIEITLEGEPLHITADDILVNAEPGWNLIGVGIDPINVSGFLGFAVYTYENGDYHPLNSTDVLQPGKSYWLGMFLTIKGSAFSDFDVNEDGKFDEADVQEVANHKGEEVSAPDVSKFDIDLDGDVDDEDIYWINYALDYREDNDVQDYFKVGVTRWGDTYVMYFKDLNEAEKFAEWYTSTLQVSYHKHRDAGNPTYCYICADFAIDTYWACNKLFLNAINYYVIGKDEYGCTESRTIYLPIAIGVTPETEYHAFNYLIVGKDITNQDSWVIFEPQEGVIYKWNELTEHMKEFYGTYVNAYFENGYDGVPSNGCNIIVSGNDFQYYYVHSSEDLPSKDWAIRKAIDYGVYDEWAGVELDQYVPAK